MEVDSRTNFVFYQADMTQEIIKYLVIHSETHHHSPSTAVVRKTLTLTSEYPKSVALTPHPNLQF